MYKAWKLYQRREDIDIMPTARPIWLVSFLGILIFIKPVQAFNYLLENSPVFNGKLQEGFNGRQIALIVIGGIFGALVLVGLLTAQEQLEY